MADAPEAFVGGQVTPTVALVEADIPAEVARP
jgi:hypothetical protein